MSWEIHSSPDQYLRYNGVGRIFVGEVGSADPGWDIGEMDGLNFNVSESKDNVTSNRYAARSIILTRRSALEGTLTYGMKEASMENYQSAMLGGDIANNNQSAGNYDAEAVSLVTNMAVDLLKINPYIWILSHDTIGGTGDNAWALGEVVTGSITGATGTIRWIDPGGDFIIVNTVSTTLFSTSDIISTPDGDTAQLTGTEIKRSVILGDDSTPTNVYVDGTDFRIDTAGFITRLSASPPDTAYVWCQFDAYSIKEMWGMASGTVQKKFTFVSDIDEQGQQIHMIFNKVDISMGGDHNLIGDGESLLPMTAAIVADTSRPTGEQFFKIRTIIPG